MNAKPPNPQTDTPPESELARFLDTREREREREREGGGAINVQTDIFLIIIT